jgi:hypothetical protein
MAERIYCGDCKNIKTLEDGWGGVHYRCKAEKTLEWDAIHKWWRLSECEKRNKDNNCSDYKRKWWKFWLKSEHK